MAYIAIIDESEAEGPLADLYRRFGNPDGTVDNVIKAHSLNAESLEAHVGLYVQSMHRPSPLSRAEREMLGVTVSRVNGCGYCLRHHASGLARLLPDDRKHVADELSAGDNGSLSARERVLAEFAETLTRAPSTVTSEDVDELCAEGLTDREILDAVQVIGYFAYANRVVLGLGAELEPPEAIGQWPSS